MSCRSAWAVESLAQESLFLFPVFSRSFPEEAFLCADLYCQAWLSLLL